MKMLDLLSKERQLRKEALSKLTDLAEMHRLIDDEAVREDRAHRGNPLYAHNRVATARFINWHRNTTRQLQSIVGAINSVKMPLWVTPEDQIEERRKELDLRESRRERARVSAQRRLEAAQRRAEENRTQALSHPDADNEFQAPPPPDTVVTASSEGELDSSRGEEDDPLSENGIDNIDTEGDDA